MKYYFWYFPILFFLPFVVCNESFTLSYLISCKRWFVNTVTNFYFKGYYVPKSDGEFYQFCYVTHAGDIRGASTPFQFRSATPTEELLTVTEDDSNSDILVVTTKTGLLEVCRTRSRDFFRLRYRSKTTNWSCNKSSMFFNLMNNENVNLHQSLSCLTSSHQ